MDHPSSSAPSFKAPEGKYHLHHERTYGTMPFNHARSTKLTLAVLQGGGPDDGVYIIYNIGEFVYLFKHRDDSQRKDPWRTLLFSSGSSSKPAAPTCHAFAAAKDGPDLLVGLQDGSVELLSLRAQLRQSATTTKPIIAATLTPEADQEGARCTAVAWIPKTDGHQFAVACASGVVYLYKKSTVIGEGPSKFLSLKSSSKNAGPFNTLNVGGGGVTDVAAAPDGKLLAISCRDGATRLLETTSGTLVAGFMSYFGAALCCCFSPDGRLVAAGAEDDLVTVYDVQDKCPIAHCEGHRSWLSSVRFDPWAGEGIAGLYRLASVGQDARLCLWEIQVPVDGEPQMPTSNMRKSGSQASLHSAGWQTAELASTTAAVAAAGPATPKNGKGSPIFPSLPRTELLLYEPIMDRKVHGEPLSDVLVADSMLYTADHTGCIKAWLRPGGRGGGDVPASSAAQQQQQQQQQQRGLLGSSGGGQNSPGVRRG